MHVTPEPTASLRTHQMFRMEWPGKSMYYLGMVYRHSNMSLKNSILNEVIAKKALTPVGHCAISMDQNFIAVAIGDLQLESAAESILMRDLYNNRFDPHCLNNLESTIRHAIGENEDPTRPMKVVVYKITHGQTGHYLYHVFTIRENADIHAFVRTMILAKTHPSGSLLLLSEDPDAFTMELIQESRGFKRHEAMEKKINILQTCAFDKLCLNWYPLQ